MIPLEAFVFPNMNICINIIVSNKINDYRQSLLTG